MSSGKKISSREYGLILGHVIIEYLTKSKSLHYGLWEDGMELSVFNLGKAQDTYTDFLLRHIPEGTKSILDIGCGVGAIAKKLYERNYYVECLSPSIILNNEARRYIPEIKIHDCKFEDFGSEKKFDLVVLVESFQYINMKEAFKKCLKILTFKGKIMICDKFKCEEKGKSPIGGGHSYSEYCRLYREFGLKLVKDIDITQKIAPNFDLLEDFSLNCLKPFSEKLIWIFQQNHPLLTKILIKMYGKRIQQKINKHLHPFRNAEGFSQYNTYRLQILEVMSS